jgi:hypothetical protein
MISYERDDMETYEKQAHVCVNGDWIKVEDVQPIDIESGPCGRDLLTFLYEGVEKQSYIVLK